jgi:hypothetical protein
VSGTSGEGDRRPNALIRLLVDECPALRLCVIQFRGRDQTVFWMSYSGKKSNNCEKITNFYNIVIKTSYNEYNISIIGPSSRGAQPIQDVAQHLDIGSHGLAQLALGPGRGEEHVVGWTTLMRIGHRENLPQMLLQKLQRALLRQLRRFRVVARPIVAVEAVARVVPEDRHLGIRRLHRVDALL